jgi:hypothetical protein
MLSSVRISEAEPTLCGKSPVSDFQVQKQLKGERAAWWREVPGHLDHSGGLCHGQPDHWGGIAMVVRMLGRAEHCALCDLEVEAYNALHRRGQVPLVPNLDLPERVRNERGYSPGTAFALIIATEFVDRFGMSRNQATSLASYSLGLHSRWKDVAKTSAAVAAGEVPTTDILFGVVDWTGATPKKRSRPNIAVGTLPEIARQYPNAKNIIAVSATRCAALLRQRAALAKIDLGDFWDR